MSIFQKLGLTTDDNENQSEEPVQPTKATGTPKYNRPTFNKQDFVPVPQVTVIGSASPDAGIVDTLNAAAAASQVPGYDQFCVNLAALQGLPDIQRYAMALNLTNANHGIGPSKVVESIDDRIALVQKEQRDFDAAFEQNVTAEVTARQNEAQALTDAIEAAKKEIQAKEAQRTNLLQEAAQAQTQLEQQKQVFIASVAVVVGSLNAEREKIAANIPKGVK